MRPSAPLVTIVLHIGFVVAGMATTLLGPILPALTERWRMSDVVAGSLFTAQFLSAMTATLVAPALAGRIGARGALALGFTLLAMGIVTIGLAPHAIGVLATVVYGLGLGFVLPLTNIAVAAAQPNRAASALSLVNVSWGVGAVIWPIAVRSLGSVESVAAPTSALAMACAVMALACRVVIPAALLSAPRSTDSADHGGAKAPPPLLSEKAEAPSPHLPPHATMARSGMVGRAVLLGTLIFLYVGTENAVAGWVAEFARRMVGGDDRMGAGADRVLGGADHGPPACGGGLQADHGIRPDSQRPRAGDARRRGDYVCRVDARRSDRRRRCDRLGVVGDLPAAVGARHAIGRRPRAGRPSAVTPRAAWAAR